MSRLIDADEVKRFYKTKFKDLDDGVHWSRNDIIMNLDNIETADIVPVIRCKDCNYYDGKWCKLHAISDFDLNDVMKSADDFCSYAERKEE